MIAAIKSFFDCLCACFKMSETKTKEAGTTYAIKDAEKLQKASDTAEDIILLAFKYKKFMTEKDRKKLIYLLRKFKRNN